MNYMDSGFSCVTKIGVMMDVFKLSLGALVTMFVVGTNSVCAASTQEHDKIITESGILAFAAVSSATGLASANTAEQKEMNMFISKHYFPKVTVKSKILAAALKMLAISACLSMIFWRQPNYSRMIWLSFGYLSSYGAGLIQGKAMGVSKIYRQLTRKFGTDWLSWGLKKAKSSPASL